VSTQLPSILDYPPHSILGEPGTTWRNDTDKLWEQLICQMHNSCGRCITMDHKVAPAWNNPFHYGCNCITHPIFPGHESQPFTDFRVELDKLDESQKIRAIGEGNWKLVESGVVKWEDVVQRSRILSLQETTQRFKLEGSQLRGVGIPEKQVLKALAIRSDPKVLAQQAAFKANVLQLRELGVSDATIKKEISAKILGKSGVSYLGPQTAPMRFDQLPGWDGAAATKVAAYLGMNATGEAALKATVPAPIPVSEVPELVEGRAAAGQRAGELLPSAFSTSDALPNPEQLAAAQAYGRAGWEQQQLELLGNRDTMEALRDYQGGVSYAINEQLRGLEPVNPARMIDAGRIESAIAAGPQTPDDLVLWRKVGKRWKDRYGDLKALVGREITDEGFMSTSLVRGAYTVSDPVEMRLSVPKGTHALHMNALPIAGYPDESIGAVEYELLLQRGSKLKVTAVSLTERGEPLLHAELVPVTKLPPLPEPASAPRKSRAKAKPPAGETAPATGPAGKV